MKILFLIGDPPTTAVDKWKEILKYKSYGYFTPSKSTYAAIKSLEKNVKFMRTIKIARKKAGLPESGITWQEYMRFYSVEAFRKKEGKARKESIKLMSKISLEITAIQGRMDLNYHLATQLHFLMYGDFVYFKFPSIIWYYSAAEENNRDEYYNHISIQINNRISKNELIKYIEQNWKNIKKSMNLPPKNKFYISDRDQRIIELRDREHLTFRQITDKIILEYDIDDPDAKINEDSVKIAYTRAKKRISSLLNTPKK